jgi:hypothetical protein
MVWQARQYGSETLEAKILALMRTRNEVTVQTAAEFNDKKRNDKNKENEMELIVTYGGRFSWSSGRNF